ncbi:Urease operon accessory protein [Rhizobium sp. RAF56]|uniref:Urease operon accessory protein n=1 Tax=Rhizobium sp. RAF56 TaxID=3233062 RepID=UPI003F94EF62
MRGQRKRTIVIVGNGDVAQSAKEAIEAADLVVRFNDCRSTSTSGLRTHVVAVCNTGRPAKAMLSSPEWRDLAAVQAASEIWSVRDPRFFAGLKASLALSHPELDDFCDDYTDEFAAFAEQTGKRHVVIDQSIHRGVEAALTPYAPEPYVVPSSGMIVIAHALAKYADAAVAIAGFGHVGWQWHPFAAEKLLLNSYAAAGRLTRLGEPAPVSSSQGA